MNRGTQVRVGKAESGFTLIELSIVLVIIGLIVGGILVGQDMIKAAEVRATTAQIEKYNSATNTFRSKYNYIPGDVPTSVATTLGIFADTGGGTVGRQDGNGLLEGQAAGAVVQIGEPITFWRHLTDVQLVDGSYGNISGTALVAASGQAGANITSSTMNQILPPAKLGRGNYLVVYASSGLNYYQLTGITAITAASGAVTLTEALTPMEAYNIDSKVDDGRPASGNVRAMEGTGPLNTAATAGATSCVFTGGAQYNYTSTTFADDPQCQLRVRFN
jgi:prepilin-type N-terminal cleavage/methylation domain-containing protein